MENEKFDYSIIFYPGTLTQIDEENRYNELGKMGFELVNIIPLMVPVRTLVPGASGQPQFEMKYKAYFKRKNLTT